MRELGKEEDEVTISKILLENRSKWRRTKVQINDLVAVQDSRGRCCCNGERIVEGLQGKSLQIDRNGGAES